MSGRARTGRGRGGGGVRRPRRAACGVTLLEVVLAVGILAIVSVAFMNVTTYALQRDARADQELGAYEVANRLVLQYLDDDTQYEGLRGKPLEYDRWRYRWDDTLERVEMEVAKRPEDRRQPADQIGLDRFRLLTVRVYYVGATGAREGEWQEMARLSRLIDPFMMRNPDASERMLESPDRMREFLRQIQGGRVETREGTGAGNGTEGGSRGGSRGGSGGAGSTSGGKRP